MDSFGDCEGNLCFVDGFDKNIFPPAGRLRMTIAGQVDFDSMTRVVLCKHNSSESFPKMIADAHRRNPEI